MNPISALPTRPLTQAELDTLRESDAVVEAAPLARAGEEIRHVALQVGDQLYGLGYRDEDGWHVVASRVAEDHEDLQEIRDALRKWAETPEDGGPEAAEQDA